MKSVQERDSRWIQRPEAASGDHDFWLALEEKHNISYIHGEMVAFSAIIIAWHCDEQPEISDKSSRSMQGAPPTKGSRHQPRGTSGRIGVRTELHGKKGCQHYTAPSTDYRGAI